MKYGNGINPLDADFIDEYVSKCRECIDMTDYSGAIISLRSMVEHVLQAIATDLGLDLKDRDDLPDLLVKVTNALGMRGEALPNEFKQITGSLTGLIQSIGAVRNRMSDAHRRSLKPLKYHAELCVDSSFAACKFMKSVYFEFKEQCEVEV